MKVNLRMNLSHFLNKAIEESVIDKLESIHKDNITYYLTLWYEDGSVKPDGIKNFLIKYENRLHFKTNIKVGNQLKTNDFVWFDKFSFSRKSFKCTFYC